MAGQQVAGSAGAGAAGGWGVETVTWVMRVELDFMGRGSGSGLNKVWPFLDYRVKGVERLGGTGSQDLIIQILHECLKGRCASNLATVQSQSQ